MKTLVSLLNLLGRFIVLVGIYAIFIYIFKYVFAISFVYVVGKHLIGRQWKETLPVMNKYLYKSIMNWDIYSNQEFYSLFNFVFLKKDSVFLFGKAGETISSNLGKNQLDKTLTIFGWALVYILWAIDIPNWRKGGHCVASIQRE